MNNQFPYGCPRKSNQSSRKERDEADFLAVTIRMGTGDNGEGGVGSMIGTGQGGWRPVRAPMPTVHRGRAVTLYGLIALLLLAMHGSDVMV